jgi:MFS family permease
VAVPSFLARERTIARPGFNRWLIPPAALAVHLCIGQVYATSVYKTALVKHFDTSLTAIGIIFSIAIVMLGLSAALFGTWVDRNGPRAAMFTSACFWSAGFLIGSLGIATDQVWLLYLGYGVIGGIGLGIGYISPVSTLIKWFPDRPGLATGMAIMGFGGGALIASPLSKQLMSWYDSNYDPATAGSLPDGHAVSLLFLTLGLVYLVFMMFGATIIRVPADGWAPAGFDPSTVKQRALVTTESVWAGNAVKTPQFWLLWIVLFCNVTAGIGILEQAAPMIQDFFRQGDGSLVAATAATGFVGLLSLFNMAGRFVWSSTSDFIGRKPIYMVYLGVGLVMYVLLATVGSSATWLFVVLAVIILSFLRRRVRHDPGLPARPLRHLPGRRHPRPAADRVVRRRCGRPPHRQRRPGHPGHPRSTRRRRLPARPVHHGRPAHRRLRREPAGPPRGQHVVGVLPGRRHGHQHLRPGRSRPMSEPTQTHTPTGLIAFAWTLVGVPLAYGLYQTIKTAVTLFTG